MDDFSSLVRTKKDDELLEIVYQLDKWNPAMLSAAEKELSDRQILPTDFADKKQAIIMLEDDNLSKGKEVSAMSQVLGWITVAGLIGIYIGYTHAWSKVKSPFTGKRYYRYDEESRKNGRYLFYSSIVGSFFFIVYRMIKMAAL